MRALRLFLVVLPALLLAAPAAFATERIATVRGDVFGPPQLVGSQVAWQELTCVRRCGDSGRPVDCPPEGLTNAYSVRLGRPGHRPRTLFRRRLSCAGSGPNHSHQLASALVSARKLALNQQSFSGSDISESITGGLRAGPRAGPLTRIFRCSRGDQIGFTGGLSLLALDGDRVAYDGTPCADSRRLAVRDLESGQTQVVPHAAVASVSSIALSGRYLGYLRSDDGVEVYDYLTGARLYAWDAPADRAVLAFGLDSDGRAAVITRARSADPATCDTEAIAWLSTDGQAHDLIGSPCGAEVTIDGDQIVYPTATRIESVSPDGTQGMIALFGSVAHQAFDSDGKRVALATATCGGGWAIYRQPVAAENSYLAGQARCEAHVAATRLHTRNGVVAVMLRCPRACAGILRLRKGVTQLGARRFGSERRGAKAVRVRLNAKGRSLLRRGPIPITVSVAVQDRDLHSHTIRRYARIFAE